MKAARLWYACCSVVHSVRTSCCVAHLLCVFMEGHTEVSARLRLQAAYFAAWSWPQHTHLQVLAVKSI